MAWQGQPPTSQTNGTEQSQVEVALTSAPAQETIDEAGSARQVLHQAGTDKPPYRPYQLAGKITTGVC
eukprot:s2325_g2.t1